MLIYNVYEQQEYCCTCASIEAARNFIGQTLREHREEAFSRCEEPFISEHDFAVRIERLVE
jgi:hypothetical protein